MPVVLAVIVTLTRSCVSSDIFSAHVGFGLSKTLSIFHELSEKVQTNVSCFDILTPEVPLGLFLVSSSSNSGKCQQYLEPVCKLGGNEDKIV